MIKKAVRLALRITTFVISSFLLVGITLILAKAMSARGGPELEWWHTAEISAEFRAKDRKTVTTLEQYLAIEADVFQELEALEEAATGVTFGSELNRFISGNEAYPVKSGRNLNRSSQMIPATSRGGVLLLHGMTDSPYSLRNIAAMFHAQGFYVLNLRLPGHGTIPAELDKMHWQDWLAAVQLGAKHVAGQLEPEQPFYVVGYSNGGSLALKYAMDSIADTGFRTPDHLFLLSPMVGVSSLAKFSRLFYWLGHLEFFRHSRWVGIIPEYDPHKYNSFPMNAGLQGYKLTTTVKQQLQRMSGNGELDQMPPVMTFQSLVDATVFTAATLDSLYEKLPSNGSELVLFDINRMDALATYVLPEHKLLLNRAMNQGSGKYNVSVLTNRSGKDTRVLELRQVAGIPGFVSRSLPYSWPEDVYSLTHVALPFPLDDEVYGLEPAAVDSGYPHLGRVQILGEFGTLILPPALLQRLRSNPFYPYIETRIKSTIAEDL